MGQDTTVNLGPVRKGKLRRQLGEDLDHLVNVDELHPALEFSWGMVPDLCQTHMASAEHTSASQPHSHMDSRAL